MTSWNQGSHCTSTSIASWLPILLGSQFDAWTRDSSAFVSKAAPMKGRVSEWADSLWPLLWPSPVSEAKLEAAKTTSLPHGLAANETIWRAWALVRRPGDCLLLDLREHRRLDSISMGLEPETLTSCTNSNSRWSTIWLIVKVKRRVCVFVKAFHTKERPLGQGRWLVVLGKGLELNFKCQLNSCWRICEIWRHTFNFRSFSWHNYFSQF